MSGDVLRFLPGLIARTDEAGEYLYSDVEILDFIAVLLIQFGQWRDMRPQAHAVLGSFARRAGIDFEDGPEETDAAMRAYLEAHPIHPDLLFEFRRGLQEGVSVPESEAVSDAFSSFLAQGGRRFDALLQKEKPAGAIAGGPMAQFFAAKAFEK